MKKPTSTILPGPFSNLKDINFGIVLIGSYIFLDFGAVQSLYEFVKPLQLPFIVASLSAIYALYLVVSGKIDFKKNTTKALIILSGFIIIDSQLRTVFEGGARTNLLAFIQYLSNYFIITACIKKPFQFVLIMDIFLISIIHSSFHSIMQGGKIYGNFLLRDENHIAIIAAYAIPFAFILFLTYQSKLKKFCYAFCLFLYVTANCVAASRGGVLGMCVGVFLLWCLSPNKKRDLFIVFITAILIISFAPQNFFNEMDSLKQGTKEGTADDRVYLWGLAWDMFLDNPVIGVGQYNYSIFYINYDRQQRYHYRHFEEGRPKVAHSTPMQWLAESGIIGAIFLLFLQVCLYKNWRLTNYKIKKIPITNDKILEKNIFLLQGLNNACGIAQIVYWFTALFLTLTPYPFYWILIGFSESWKNIVINYAKNYEKLIKSETL